VDVLIVSLGSTAGLRAADSELAGALRRVGASVAVVSALPPKRALRTLALTDLAWALAARRAALAGLAEHRPQAIVYSSTTAALLWPRPGAIRFDAPAAGNRPGRHGLWQRPLERRRLGQAPLLLPWSEGGLAEALPDDPSAAAYARARALVLPVPVEPSVPMPAASSVPVPGEPSGPPIGAPGLAPARDIAAIAYAANPLKKGVDRVLAAWAQVRKPGEELLLAGATSEELARAGVLMPSGEGQGAHEGAGDGSGVRVVGPLPPAEYRALLRRAKVFVCAPRREDYGIAQLEALADGCLLVTTPAPGPYVALRIARDLDARLVSGDLGAALRAALDEPANGYPALAAAAIGRFRRAACDRVVRDELSPRLRATAM
jgi:glycosyltransferase involved in cell wall biosynthesis